MLLVVEGKNAFIWEMERNSDTKIKLEILYWKFGKMLPDCLTKRNIFQIMLVIACWFAMLQDFF